MFLQNIFFTVVFFQNHFISILFHYMSYQMVLLDSALLFLLQQLDIRQSLRGQT